MAAWLKRRLELERLMGTDVLYKGLAHAAAPCAGPDAAPPDDQEARLAEVDAQVRACTKCRLSESRTQTVFCRGNPYARLMFIGEGPGQEEDRQGLAFVGPAGQLLDKMIFAMGLTPDDVYICNIVKCRPPGNREPRPDEAAACRPYLDKQIELVRPRIICTLGRPAANSLLRTDESMGALRGRWQEFRGVPVLPTYHPAYLLRSPSQKKVAWQDLKLVIAALAEASAANDK